MKITAFAVTEKGRVTMARNKYGIQKIVQNDLQQCINSFRRMRNGGIGIADECVEQTCKMALKHIDKLEAKLENSVEVVRCKDCKWYKESKLLAPNKFCFRLKDRNGDRVGYNFAPDDFCSYGERKDE